jgi:hypothetical protein
MLYIHTYILEVVEQNGVCGCVCVCVCVGRQTSSPLSGSCATTCNAIGCPTQAPMSVCPSINCPISPNTASGMWHLGYSMRHGRIRHSAARQHTSAYVSIRQHTSAYVSIRLCNVSIRLMSGCTRIVLLFLPILVLSSYVSIRQHTSAYVSIRQHTSAYVSIR